MTDSSLKAIAKHGTREHVLRELEARGAMGELSTIDVAREQGVDTDDPEVVAQTFVSAWDDWVEDTQSESQHAEWLESVEKNYGDIADSVLASRRSDDGL